MNDLPHTSQEKGFSPLCVCVCVELDVVFVNMCTHSGSMSTTCGEFDLCEQVKLHTSQEYGRSPVSRCVFNEPFCENCFPHGVGFISE